MLKIKKIDHVAVCVSDIDDSAARWRTLFGLAAQGREVVESQKTEAVLLPVGETSVELISPRGNDGLARFLEKRGPGLHHIALRVPDLNATVERLRAQGARLLNEPRAGAGGHIYVFVHPASTGGVLLELIQEHE